MAISDMKLTENIRLTERHRRLLALVMAQKGRLLTSMACMALMAGTTSASAWLVKPVIDDIFFNRDTMMLKLLPLAIVGIYVLRGLAMYGQEFLMEYVGNHIIRQLRDQIYYRIMELPIAYVQEEKTGALMSRITYDVNLVKIMVSSAVAAAVRDTLTIIGLTCVIFYMDWRMAIMAFFVLPFAFIPLVRFGRRVRKTSTGVQEAMAELSVLMHETFVGSKIVKAFGMEEYEKKRFSQKTADIFGREVKTARAKSLSSPVMEFLGGLAVAFVIWYGGFNVIRGYSSPGTFFAFLTAVIMLYDPVKKLTKINNAVQEGMAAAHRVFDIIETESNIREAADPVTMDTKPHRVRFDNVYFGYNDEETVLRGINLDVPSGKILAIVGVSGGGKTSMVNLIPRFYDVSRGAILIDGVDIRKIGIKSLRRQIAMVTQEPVLFNDTVRNNIAYGNLQAPESEIVAAAKAAYAYDFIQSFPKGFDTSVGELGGKLSGGEKQRICIARALLKNAPILILDEATSSLDTEAEALVQKALENLMQGRTTFVIAHRLSTIVGADQIIVLKQGRIIESGSHSELLAIRGEYYKLYQMQFKNQ